MKNSIALKMLKSTLWTVMIFGALSSCSKDDDSIDAKNQLSKEGIATQDAFKSEPGKQTPSPITPWATPGATTIWDNNDKLMTALWAPPGFGPAFPNYSFAQFPITQGIPVDVEVPGTGYDFSPYYVNGEEEYNPANYDLMAHFGYFSPVDVDNAVVEFTFENIEYFLPHMLLLDASGQDTRRLFTVKNVGSQTVITCVTDLKQAYWNSATPSKRIGSPMFCFLLKIDCNGNNNTTFWTDMKVNGVSVKGTIKDKVFDCQKTTAHSWSDYVAFDLLCGDNIVDHISGTVKYHCVMQYEDGYEDGVLLFMNMTYNGALTGDNTGEVFSFKQITTYDLTKSDDSSDNFHFNAIGDRGSHFIVSGKYLYLNEDPWIIVEIDKARCSD